MDHIINFIGFLFDFILHIDEHLVEIIDAYGSLTFIIVFLIIFCETGLIVTPFLPGDSLIFALGSLGAIHAFNPILMYVTLLVAAILGDTINYYIASKFGARFIDSRKIKFIKMEHIEKTEAFFEKHGGKTIVIARFMPIIRTFAPFVAGVSKMRYSHFITYNILGAFLWITIFFTLGFFFGNIQFVQDNFSLILIAIVIISVLPGLIVNKLNSKKQPDEK